MKRLFITTICLTIIISLNLTGILAVGRTFAYFHDNEGSEDNEFAASILDFIVEKEEMDNRFQTYTQGGWSSAAHGENPGAYRDANFENAFPNGVSIGDPGGYEALFTTSGAVESFLPAGGPSGSFTTNHIDPLSTEAGILAGQILALTLNVGFDLYDPNFAESIDNLENFMVNNSSNLCYGMTVGNVLEQGNLVLAGLPSTFTPSEINECAAWINEKFVNGGEEGVICPGESLWQFATIIDNGSLSFQYTVHAEKTAGDDDFCNALNLEALLEGSTHYSGSLLGFISSPVIYSASTDEWEFIISLPKDADTEGTCDFDFVFSGWQASLPSFGGFNDIEKIENSLTEGCPSSCGINVIYPNGGEIWYIVPGPPIYGFGTYNITWEATSTSYDANELDIDIWFCRDSGNDCFLQIADNTENDGSYWWTLPYDIQFKTDQARIKIVAEDPDGLICEDMSDADFCPPMLTEEELTALLLSVNSITELMNVKIVVPEVQGTSTDDGTEDEGDSLFDEIGQEEDIDIGSLVDPLSAVTPSEDGLNPFGGSDGEESEGDSSGQGEDADFEIEGEIPPIGKLEDPIITVTPEDDGLEE